MTRDWREHDEALEELLETAKWYERKAVGLGSQLMDAVDVAIESLLDPAVSWGFHLDRRSDPQVYSRSVAGFPIDIVYLLLADEVYIVAYASEKKRPGYWRGRLPS